MPIVTGRFKGHDTDGNELGLDQPSIFRNLGPLIEVILTPPQGSQGVSAQQGYAIIDTGASRTCVDAETAKNAGWPIIDTARLSSVTHPDHVVSVFTQGDCIRT